MTPAKFQVGRYGLLETWCGRRVEAPLVCLDPARATCTRCLAREAAEGHSHSYGAPTDAELGIVES